MGELIAVVFIAICLRWTTPAVDYAYDYVRSRLISFVMSDCWFLRQALGSRSWSVLDKVGACAA